MISTIHDAVNEGRKDRKPNMEIRNPYVAGQYSKLMKGVVDRAHQYLSF
jgi:hypothetical protein